MVYEAECNENSLEEVVGEKEREQEGGKSS